MGFLKDQDRKKIGESFLKIANDVKVLMFTQDFECDYCKDTRELLQEVAGLSDHIKLEVHDFVAEEDLAKKYGIDKIPALAILGDRDYGIRYYGVPAGYEFASLIEDLVDVGRRDHGLPKTIADELAKVDKPVHMQVFVTPTCPYCPRAVRTAHRFAMASDFITSDMVEASEFPHLVERYHVNGVPHTVINEEMDVVGAQPDMAFAKAVLKSIGKA